MENIVAKIASVNRERLDEFSESRIERFRDFLGRVSVVEDLFPPDTCSVREPRRPIPPTLINAMALSLEQVAEPVVCVSDRSSLLLA